MSGEAMEGCRCACGYRCGGPGRCELDVLECLQQETGHFVRDCEHDFTGPGVDVGEHGWSVTCARCGLTAASHDMCVGP